MHSPVVLVLFCSVGLVASQCNHDHDHGEHDHSSLPQGPVRPKTNAPDVPKVRFPPEGSPMKYTLKKPPPEILAKYLYNVTRALKGAVYIRLQRMFGERWLGCLHIM